MMGHRLALGVALGLGSLSHAARAESADSDHRLDWSFRRPGAWEYAGTTAVAAAAIYVELGTDQPLAPKWSSTLGFEPPVR